MTTSKDQFLENWKHNVLHTIEHDWGVDGEVQTYKSPVRATTEVLIALEYSDHTWCTAKPEDIVQHTIEKIAFAVSRLLLRKGGR